MACYARQARTGASKPTPSKSGCAQRTSYELRRSQKETIGLNTGAKGIGTSKEVRVNENPHSRPRASTRTSPSRRVLGKLSDEGGACERQPDLRTRERRRSSVCSGPRSRWPAPRPNDNRSVSAFAVKPSARRCAASGLDRSARPSLRTRSWRSSTRRVGPFLTWRGRVTGPGHFRITPVLCINVSQCKRSLQGATQHVGCQVEVVCNAFSDHAPFSDFDPGDPGEPDPWRLAPEPKFTWM